ncbi:hypothetical protein HBH64_205700 [Parastagonospora nodorum]|nr:hypothetical protein HBH53_201690 [Parastagonospora nodorum]KAH3992955.1 hypothetical protein HBI10_210200 [Parastagonospora nodorum]KAH4077992.1 hypothetical protein HBH48_236840 [Parastagonospora nodorum]KAH4149781.1 hypothetical protein HBH44_189590 [Parastagonospora nodorum]KAH4229534.1 hypothetical protein HBI05_197100 [Parastagonospora nodorum]
MHAQASSSTSDLFKAQEPRNAVITVIVSVANSALAVRVSRPAVTPYHRQSLDTTWVCSPPPLPPLPPHVLLFQATPEYGHTVDPRHALPLRVSDATLGRSVPYYPAKVKASI